MPTRGLSAVDRILRPRRSVRSLASGDANASQPIEQSFISLRKVAIVAAICGPAYGMTMGSYAWISGERTLAEQLPQLIYSAVKVPLLIAMTVAISLPSFFIINTLLGLRDDFAEALRAIVSAQAGLAIILCSLFPLTMFFYVSLVPGGNSYTLAVLFNAVMFGLASVSAQILLREYYRPLTQRSPKHRWMVRLWIFVYAFVGIQAAYTLRPFIDSPGISPTFFRDGGFENAYVKIFEMLSQLLRSRSVV